MLMPLQLTHHDGESRASKVRRQAAYLRALLDDVERVLPSGLDHGVSEELLEDLRRLGYRCIEAASSLTTDAAVQEESGPKLKESPRCV